MSRLESKAYRLLQDGARGGCAIALRCRKSPCCPTDVYFVRYVSHGPLPKLSLPEKLPVLYYSVLGEKDVRQVREGKGRSACRARELRWRRLTAHPFATPP